MLTYSPSPLIWPWSYYGALLGCMWASLSKYTADIFTWAFSLQTLLGEWVQYAECHTRPWYQHWIMRLRLLSQPCLHQPSSPLNLLHNYLAMPSHHLAMHLLHPPQVVSDPDTPWLVRKFGRPRYDWAVLTIPQHHDTVWKLIIFRDIFLSDLATVEVIWKYYRNVITLRNNLAFWETK